jgi:hypothetical protein
MTAKQKANQLRFKKVAAEAKKLRSKNPKLTQAQAVKKVYANLKKGKKLGETHKDTKSHNVNIRVVSGNKTKDRWSNYYKYKSKIITKLYPSGMYELYDDKKQKFVKFDQLSDAKTYINNINKKISGWRKGKTAIIEKNEKPIKRLKNVRVSRIAKNSRSAKPGTFRNFKTIGNVKIANVPTYKDKDAAREIQLYADNDSTLYFQRKLPILKNLQKKYQKGTFDVNKAAKLWQYYVEAAMQKYNKDFGSRGDKWSDLLSVPDRKLLSMEYAMDTLSEFQSGNFYQ